MRERKEGRDEEESVDVVDKAGCKAAKAACLNLFSEGGTSSSRIHIVGKRLLCGDRL